MNRRELAKTMALGVSGVMLEGSSVGLKAQAVAMHVGTPPPQSTPALTVEVAEFVHRTSYDNLPKELIDLGKKFAD